MSLHLRGSHRVTLLGFLLLLASSFRWTCAALASDSGRSPIVYRSETGRISGLDPAKVGDVASALAVSKIYEGLLQYAYLDRPYRVIPCLAEALPTVTSNGLCHTFRLRKGIFFQNDPCFRGSGRGREVTADDFVYSFKRLADLNVASSGYWVFRGRIAGLEDFRNASAGHPADYAREVDGLKATDRHTLEIRLTHPCPELTWILAMSYTFVVPREAVEFYGGAFGEHPVGTGPYCLESWSQNYRIVFNRNPKWIQTGRTECYPASGTAADSAVGLLADAGKPIPFIDRIEEYVIGDASTQWLMFLAGELETSGISRDNWDAVLGPNRELRSSLREKGIVLSREPALSVSYLGFNMEDPVVGTNRALRRGLTCAFDRDKWCEFLNGRVMAAASPVPPSIRTWERAGSPFPFDVKRAAELLAEAGYPNGRDPVTGRRLELTIELGSGETETRETAELLAHFMQAVGVVLRPSFNNRPAFFKKLEQRRAQMFLVGWEADYPDPENFLQLFYSPNASPGANHCNYHSADADRLYEAAALTLDPAERNRLFGRMEDLVVADCPVIFLHHDVSFGLRQANLLDYKPHNFPYGMIKYYRLVDLDARARR